MVRPRCFLPGPTKKFSPQNGEKTKGRKCGCLMDKNAHVQFIFFFFLLAEILFSSLHFHFISTLVPNF